MLYGKEELNEFKSSAIDAIAKGAGLNDIVKLAYDTFKLSVIVVDVGYKRLAYAVDEPLKDPYWKDIIDEGEPTENTIMDYYLKDGFLDAISHSEGAIVVDWGICKEYPQSSGPIYLDNTLEGFVSILFLDYDIKDFALELNSLLCKLCSIIMRSINSSVKTRKNPMKDILTQKIFDEDIATAVNFSNANLDFYRPYVDVTPGFIVMVVSCETPESDIIEHVRSRMKSRFRNMLFMTRNRKIYVFIYGASEERFDSVKEEFRYFMDMYRLRAGVSTVFTDLSKRHIYIEQAETSLTAGKHANSSSRMYTFDEYYETILLLLPAATLHYENAVLESIRLLYDEDKANGTDYIDTLDAYLSNRNDIRVTAEQLHIHRNTLNYRLQRIEDILKKDINEPLNACRMQLSILVLKNIFRKS